MSLLLENVTLTPSFVHFLKKASYCLSYDTSNATILLYGNDGGVSTTLLTITSVPYAVARSLAALLGLPPAGESRVPTLWGRKVIFFKLHFNDTEGARTLYEALNDLKVPHEVVYGSRALILEFDDRRYNAETYTVSQMQEFIGRAAAQMKSDALRS